MYHTVLFPNNKKTKENEPVLFSSLSFSTQMSLLHQNTLLLLPWKLEDEKNYFSLQTPATFNVR